MRIHWQTIQKEYLEALFSYNFEFEFTFWGAFIQKIQKEVECFINISKNLLF